jgi:UDP-GlcNAc:undecaprenyl-phosphate GlcNAc-1-phosphate transferase
MAFAGSLTAFLYFNNPPAHIYLGDAGSLLIGGFLAAIPSMISWGQYDFFGFLAPLIILFVPFAELGTLIMVRSWKGIPFYQGSPHHFCHYLRKAGWSTFAILCFVVMWNLLLFFVAQAYITQVLSLKSMIFIGIFLVAIWWNILFFSSTRLFVAFGLFLIWLQRRYSKNPLFIAFRVLHDLMQK